MCFSRRTHCPLISALIIQSPRGTSTNFHKHRSTQVAPATNPQLLTFATCRDLQRGCVYIQVSEVKVLITQSCQTLCGPMYRSPLRSSICGILQARILEWVVMLFSRGSSWLRDQTRVSCIAGRFFTGWATREAIFIFHLKHLKVHSFCVLFTMWII